MSIAISMTVNGKAVSKELDTRTLLVEFLREHLRLTGTHVGCDTAHCGACTVHVDGRATKSCNVLAAQMEGASIVTIEGVATDGELHPMQAAFREHQMLTGQHMFVGDTAVEVAMSHVNQQPPALPEHLADYQRLMDKLVEKDRDARFRNADEVLGFLARKYYQSAAAPSADITARLR